MIYLIDDKKLRQETDFGWGEDKLEFYNHTVKTIYDLEGLKKNAEVIFKDGNVILFHESFLDNSNLKEEASLRRDKLEEFAKKHENFYLVIFSGSKTSRYTDKNTAYLPVSIVYQNLKTFLEKYLLGDLNLKYLAFGKNIRIESDLIEKREIALSQLENSPADVRSDKNLFITTFDKKIKDPIKDTSIATLFAHENDLEITEFIKKHLLKDKFENIFLPLCFGKTLSDYNGLRLASHIRCTKTPNQNSNLFIYGFVSLDYIYTHKYFNIIKTKNVSLVDFKKKAFEESGNISYEQLNLNELSVEMKKLKLDPPKNYFDSHHIANEWGIYQMARNANIPVETLEGYEQDKLDSLYFKWLKTINETHKDLPEEQIKEQRQYGETLKGLTVVGKIDLEKFNRK